MPLEGIEKTMVRRRTETAVVHGNERLTFGELSCRSDSVAASLINYGLNKGEAVGLRLEASLDYPAACLGVWRAGGVLVPLGTRTSHSELEHFASLASIRILVGEADGTHADIPELDVKRLLAAPTTGVETRRSPVEDFLIWLTSGTTGTPKGVVHTPHSMETMLNRQISMSGLDEEEVVLATSMINTAFGFSSYLMEPMYCGARVVIVQPLEPRAALEAAHREQVTRIQTVPAVLNLLADVEPLPRLPCLRAIQVGGATLDDASRESIVARLGIQPIQGYGMSEVGRIASTGGEPDNPSCGIVGRPWIDLKLFDENGRVLPTGEVGEIGVRAPSLCRPYYLLRGGAREPLAIRDGWFMTGDLGRFTTDGYLALAGRRKSFILTPGAKVNPREVEDVLLQHPAVIEAAVVPQPGRAGYEAIKAVVSARSSVSTAELLTFCSEHLEAGKLPHIVQFVDHLPRNGLGKVETGKLVSRADGIDAAVRRTG